MTTRESTCFPLQHALSAMNVLQSPVDSVQHLDLIHRLRSSCISAMSPFPQVPRPEIRLHQQVVAEYPKTQYSDLE